MNYFKSFFFFCDFSGIYFVNRHFFVDVENFAESKGNPGTETI